MGSQTQGPCRALLTGHCPATQINTFQSWRNIANADALIKLAPAAGATLLLLLTLKFGRSPLALPAVLDCIPVSSYPFACASQALPMGLWHSLLYLSVSGLLRHEQNGLSYVTFFMACEPLPRS